MRLGRLRAWIAFIRDLGLVIGVPALIGVGLWLHEAQINATEAQTKASEAQTKLAEAHNAALKDIFEAQEKAAAAHAKAVEAQNATLKETQYDRALAQINSQKALFDQERAEAKKQLDEERAGALAMITSQKALLDQDRAEAKKQLDEDREALREIRRRVMELTTRRFQDRDLELRLRDENKELRGRLGSQTRDKEGSPPPPP